VTAVSAPGMSFNWGLSTLTDPDTLATNTADYPWVWDPIEEEMVPVGSWATGVGTAPAYRVIVSDIVPEPVTLALLGSGLLGLIGMRRRRRIVRRTGL